MDVHPNVFNQHLYEIMDTWEHMIMYIRTLSINIYMKSWIDKNICLGVIVLILMCRKHLQDQIFSPESDVTKTQK